MPSFADTLRALNSMRDEGVVEDYAVAGAMALIFWTEPVATLDLDVLVLLPPAEGAIVSLSAIYRWAEARGFGVEGEHILIEGVPTQFVPSPNDLADEAIASSVTLDYEGVLVKVVRPEYLIALYLEPSARTPRRRERAAALLELPDLDRELVADIVRRFEVQL
jgi:hypothetical protein